MWGGFVQSKLNVTVPGRGLGGDLLRRCLARYGHTTLVALVDDPADAGFYAHHGFRATGLAMVKDAAPPP